VKCIADISDIDISFNVKDGDLLNPNDICFYGTGLTSQILRIERVMLNLIQHLSGVATQVSCFVKTLNDDRIKILDTRKTIPGLRDLQKYAVRVGGGVNHRFTLSDMILIKDNHIQVCGGIVSAIEKALVAKQRHLIKIEVECDSVQLVRDICGCLDVIDVVMLDNMSISDIELCSTILRSVKKDILIEVSGGVTLENIASYKGLDIDYISSGAITHSVSAVDISLDITGIEAE
jgi:nicotinate-nucleotide pyrophosphorylase (carboxylating)